jgi:glycerol-3-phosphate dehydrogenase (NAD(P)+)
VARLAVLGATSWGITLAWLLERNGHGVTVLVRTEDEAGAVRARRGIVRLPEVQLGPGVNVEPPGRGGEAYDGLVMAVPLQALRATLGAWTSLAGTPALSAAKGIERGTVLRASEVIAEAGWAAGAISVLSGPNLAHEIVRGMPAAAVVAAKDPAQADMWQAALSEGAFRCYTATDVLGVELAGALKNVIAIASGAAWGLNFGANAVAAIMTRGLAEIARLGVALGADAATFDGLAGVGDLAATCFSPLSRNRRLGELLAQGRSPAEATAEIGEVVEGAATATVALTLAAKAGVELPIAAAVAAVLERRWTVGDAMRELLMRPLKAESGGRNG